MRLNLLVSVLESHERKVILRQWLLKTHDVRQKKILPPARKRRRDGIL